MERKPTHMPRAIAIMNQKGGVGKTTTTLNLGAVLAQRGKRVLVIDLDPQANLTLGLGRRAADLSESVYELLTDPKADAMKYIVPTQWENLHLVPSHIDLSGAEIEMVTMIGRETRLSKALASARDKYDYILIDCLPSLSLLTVNAMAAASEVLVPLQAHPFALEGLGKLFEVVGMIREAMNPELKVTGVLVTMFDGRTNVSKVTLEALRRDDRLREHIFTTTIKQNIKVAESQKDGIPVVAYDPSCHASKAYQALGAEVLEMESGCLASACAARITAREEASGDKLRTFTPDLIAPASPSSGASGKSEAVSETPQKQEHNAKEDIPATPSEHSAPVSALVQHAPEPEQSAPAPTAPAKSALVESAPEGVSVPRAPTPVDEPELAVARHRNPPDVEVLHPSNGIHTNDLSIEAAQAALSGTVALKHAPDVSDEDYRPRLNLKPGSCKVPLPPT
jgi:chromosome partitioning protein